MRLSRIAFGPCVDRTRATATSWRWGDWLAKAEAWPPKASSAADAAYTSNRKMR